jgi:TonB family protein
MDYLYWLLLSGGCLALLLGLARVLPVRTYALLRWLQWGAVGLGLGVPLALWLVADWTLRTVAPSCLLLLLGGLVAGVRIRLGLPAVRFLSYGLAGVAVAAGPLLLGGMGHGARKAANVVYCDAQMTVTVTPHFSLSRIADPRLSDSNLYRARWLLFDEYVGWLTPTQERPLPQAMAWWRQASHLTFYPDSGRVHLRWKQQALTLAVNRPRAEPAAVPAPPLPATQPAAPRPPDSSRVYTYVQVMPRLPGGRPGSQQELIGAIQWRLIAPAHVPRGRVFVSFIIRKNGKVSDLRMVRGLAASVDAAVLDAVARLPLFIPGRQNGQLVDVSMTVPIDVGVAQRPAPPRHPQVAPLSPHKAGH